jgi:large subunit ribosomal protein L7/L12
MNTINKNEDVVKMIESMTVTEMLDLIKKLKELFGISDEMLSSGPSSSSSMAAAVEDTIKNVVLTEIKEKLNAVKAIKNLLGCSLGEANTMQADVVAGKKLVLKENAAPEDFKAISDAFGTAGTIVLEVATS